MVLKEFHYRIAWRASSAHPGAHPSQAAGGGGEFRGHTTLIEHKDPRRLDLHATVRDPFGQYKIKQFAHTCAIPVFAIADLSASMAIGGKFRLLSQIATSIAYSAYRTGDPCGFVGVSDGIVFYSPPRLTKSQALELKSRLEHLTPQKGGLGLKRLAPYLGKKRALVFLLSDFHFPLAEVQTLLMQLKHHDVVPVVLWSLNEQHPPKRWGWARLCDPETGHCRSLWLKRRSQAELSAAFHDRRMQLTELCRRYGRPPFFVEDEFHPDQLSRYFLTPCA